MAQPEHKQTFAIGKLRDLMRFRDDRAAGDDGNAGEAPVRRPGDRLRPDRRQIHAAVLAANGRKDEAKSEISQLRTDQLLQEEKRLIENL